MPKLINYLKHLGPGQFYNDLEMEHLQHAYDEACSRLRLPDDDSRRERVAMMIFEEAKTGMDSLPARVIARFGHLG
jgi:hypothetical protein